MDEEGDELLRMQRLFKESNEKPSATLKSTRITANKEPDTLFRDRKTSASAPGAIVQDGQPSQRWSDYKGLPVLGSVREKGRDASGASAASPARHTLALPVPSVRPFPEARHRSLGLTWPNPAEKSRLPAPATLVKDEDSSADGGATIVQPLGRRKLETTGGSKWARQRAQSSSTKSSAVSSVKAESQPEACDPDTPADDEHAGSREGHDEDPAVIQERVESGQVASSSGHEPSNSFKGGMEPSSSRKSLLTEAEQVDAENRATIAGMTQQEVEEARAELEQRLSPALLALLKERGERKLMGQQQEDSEVTAAAAASSAKGMLPDATIEGRRGPGGASLRDQALAGKSRERVEVAAERKPAAETMLSSPQFWHEGQGAANAGVEARRGGEWAARVEAVRELRFSIEGDPVPSEASKQAEVMIGLGAPVLTPAGDSASALGDETESQAAVIRRLTVAQVTQRDLLRSEGDPAAAGYSLREMVALARSAVPGQRTMALQLLTLTLLKASESLSQPEKCVQPDWPAIWAYALGPELQLALALRLALDDEHSAVIQSALRALQTLLSCGKTEAVVQEQERLWQGEQVVATGPVFRRPPGPLSGYEGSAPWKSNVKVQEVLNRIAPESRQETDTVGADMDAAVRDVAAGLLEMGILPRLRFILEVMGIPSADDAVLAVLTALAQHSRVAAHAVFACPRLLPTVTERFLHGNHQQPPPQVTARALGLLKVLCQGSRSDAKEIVEMGLLPLTTVQVVQTRQKFSPHSSAPGAVPHVQALRLWRVLARYDLVNPAALADLYPALCSSLMPLGEEAEAVDKILFLERTGELYLLLEALVSRMADAAGWEMMRALLQGATSWLSPASLHQVLALGGKGVQALAAVLHFLASGLERLRQVANDVEGHGDAAESCHGLATCLYSALRRGLLLVDAEQGYALSAVLTLLRDGDPANAAASLSCLLALVRCIRAVVAKRQHELRVAEGAGAGKIGPDGLPAGDPAWDGELLRSALLRLLAVTEPLLVRNAHQLWVWDRNDRGGPAPGLGPGWGIPGGGFWSVRRIALKMAAHLAIPLVEMLWGSTDQRISVTLPPGAEEDAECAATSVRAVNVVLAAVSLVGPEDQALVLRALESCLLQPPLLGGFLSLAAESLVASGASASAIPDAASARGALLGHYVLDWLAVKATKMKTSGGGLPERGVLQSIAEEGGGRKALLAPAQNLMVDWMGSRLPLPPHWPLSALRAEGPAGLAFLLALEAAGDALPAWTCHVPLVRKLHALSEVFVLDAEQYREPSVRPLLQAAQEELSKQLCIRRGPFLAHSEHAFKWEGASSGMSQKAAVAELPVLLNFEQAIGSSYETYAETLTGHFVSNSFGDILFARQVAVLLQRQVAATIRLRVWHILNDTKMLSFLPSAHECIGQLSDYFHPPEDDVSVLERYIAAWCSGALDKAIHSGALSFQLALHHIAYLLFEQNPRSGFVEQLKVKAMRSLLRFAAHGQGGQVSVPWLLRYPLGTLSVTSLRNEGCVLQQSELQRRIWTLEKACGEDLPLSTALSKIVNQLVHTE